MRWDRFWAMTALAGAVWPSSARAAGAHPLRIEEAVALALSRSEIAKIADEEVIVADAAVEKARVGFLPTMVATGNDVQRPYVVRSPSSGAITQPSNIATAGGTITQPLLNASAWPLYRQAERLRDAQEASSEDQKRLLAFGAATTFLQVLSVEQVRDAAQRRLDTAKATLADTQARVSAGLNSSNDVTRAQLGVASSVEEVANDDGSVRRAYVSLELVLNAEITPPLAPPTVALKAAAQPLGPLDKLVASAEGRRLDLVASKHAARAAHLFADEPLLRIVPVVGLAAGVTGTSNPGATGRSTDETLTGTLTWTLYDAGNRYADKHSRDATARIADLQMQLLERQIRSDVGTAVASLQSSQAAFQAAADAVNASRKSVDETATLYRQGLATALELTDANDARFEAEVAYVGAEFAMALAYLALRQAMGLDPLGTVLS
jgi:outer membrane protein TolC